MAGTTATDPLPHAINVHLPLWHRCAAPTPTVVPAFRCHRLSAHYHCANRVCVRRFAVGGTHFTRSSVTACAGEWWGGVRRCAQCSAACHTAAGAAHGRALGHRRVHESGVSGQCEAVSHLVQNVCHLFFFFFFSSFLFFFFCCFFVFVCFSFFSFFSHIILLVRLYACVEGAGWRSVCW
jgi:hypothetical protein